MASYKLLLTALVMIVVATTSIEASRRGRGRRPPSPQSPPSPPSPAAAQQECENCVSWIRDLSGDDDAVESARFDTESLLIQVKSLDDNLTASNLTKSISLYTFDEEGSNGVLVVRLIGVGWSPCFLVILQSSNFNDTVALLDTRNDSTVAFDSSLEFDGVTNQLGPWARSAVFQVVPVIGRICRNRPLIFADQLGVGDDAPANSEPFTFLSLENRITIYARPTRPRGRGRRDSSEEDD